MLTIGKPITIPLAQNSVCWEFANELRSAPDNVFMNIPENEAKKFYDAAREKGGLVFKKLTDQGDTTRSSVCNYYMPSYVEKAYVDGQKLEKFLGMYSLAHTMRVFTAGIIFLSGSNQEEESVLCVVSGQNRPSYIFDPSAGTLQKTDSLYDSLFDYIPEGVHIMAYIVSTDEMPIVVKVEEPEPEPEPEKKPAITTTTKKRPRKEEKEKEEGEEEPKKVVSTTSESGKKRKTVEEKVVEVEAESEEKKPKKKVVRRKRIAAVETE